LGMLAQPQAIERHHGRHRDDRFTACLPQQRLDLSDAVVDSTSAYTPTGCATSVISRVMWLEGR
jgi:hypothetical protein